jgi:nucleotide-binding universal stress UspA family protein
MGRQDGAKVCALYVIELGHQYPLDASLPRETAAAESVLEQIDALSHEERCPADTALVQARHAGPAIVREALDRNIDLITMAAGYEKGSQVLSETVLYVLSNAPCPVLLWREPPRQNGAGH